MRSRMATWYETKIKYDKMMDNGMLKTTTELYVVDALSFTEAEKQIMEEMSAFISGDFKITNIVETTYKEIFFSDMEADDRWFKVKLQFITIDEKTEKERKQNVYHLVQAANLQKAVKAVDEYMGKTMIDYTIASVAETSIMDVFEHGASAKAKVDDRPEYESE